ncbi:RNA ligase-domain-containing protein [Dichotomocladium elegans]|nr:RNA ligase-domain-containing protein [Dichotomocladium elegans]
MDIPPLEETYDDHAVIKALEELERNSKKILRSKLFKIRETSVEWRSWTMREHMYKKKNNVFPTMARGLFTAKEYETAEHPILVRGYDKFFNVQETDATQWSSLKSHTEGPYYATSKENGCINFIAAVDDSTVIVTSKHTIPNPHDDHTHHGGVGYRWLLKHLDSVGLKEADLASWLFQHNVTLVAELCDDQFEEHIIPYAPKESGLYLHGINYNVSVLHTVTPETVQQVARHFGFLATEFTKLDTIEEIQALANQIAKDGKYLGRMTEGIVGEVQLKPDVKPCCNYEKSIYYVLWLHDQVKEHPEWFKAYNQNKGIIHVRMQFEDFWDSGLYDSLQKDPTLYKDKTDQNKRNKQR